MEVDIESSMAQLSLSPNAPAETEQLLKSPLQRFSKTEIDEMTTHVFFPRKLPQSQPSTLLTDEANLLSVVNETVSLLYKKYPDLIPVSTLRMFQAWNTIQSHEHLDENLLYEAIHSLDVGDMFALYIRQQNCGLILSMPKYQENQAIISTFQASLSNETITLSPGDIQMTYPAQSMKIPFSHLLASRSFCQQLSILHTYDSEMAMAEAKKAGVSRPDCRNVADPILVSQWLAASLVDKDSTKTKTSKDEFPNILKKVRDQVLMEKEKLLPFRRSGFWMTIKVALQLNLQRELGEKDGYLLYKLILAVLMRAFCDSLSNNRLEIDLALQMLAKLARRLEKMKQCSGINGSLQNMYKDVQQLSSKTIHNIRAKMDDDFRRLCDSDWKAGQRETLKDLKFEADIYHSIPILRNYIKTQLNHEQSKNSSGYVFNATIYNRHYVKQSSLPPLVNLIFSTDEIALGLTLHDIENWIFSNLNAYDFHASEIRNLLFSYIEKSKGYYKNDPRGASRMILTALKIVQTLDEIAVETYPLLIQHSSGIQTSIIKQLLLPQRKDLEDALALEIYFDTRNGNSTKPSLIEEKEITKNSFSARYAEADTEMCLLKNTILAEDERNIQRKKVELAGLKETVASLKRQLIGVKCVWIDRINRRGITYRHKVWPCSKCRIEKELAAIYISVYEKTLKEEKILRNAVVFELLIPEEIACLRDALYTFVKEFCQTSMSGTYITESWTEHSSLMGHRRGNYQQRVHLGTSTRSYGRTHFRTIHVHSSTSDSQVIAVNGCNCHFYGSTSDKTEITRSNPTDDVKEFCTLKVEAESPYSSLQWALRGTQHSQNKILAEQSDCPREITLQEWIEFGSLRAGHRLQMRNIFKAIEAGSLSFKNESVVSLILQSLWEAGPNESCSFITKWHRDSHHDLVDTAFSLQCGKALLKFLNSQKNNWKHPYNLLTVIMMTLRVLELNSDDVVAELFIGLLLKCRAVAVEWMENIEQVIKTFSNTDKNELLRNILVKVAVCCSMTFSVDPTKAFFSQILSASSVTTWILSLVKINNNNILRDKGTLVESKSLLREKLVEKLSGKLRNLEGESDDSFLTNMLRIIRKTGLDMQNKINELISVDNFKELNIFAADQWRGSKDDFNEIWLQSGTTFYKTTKDKNNFERCVQIDVILGQFLVDGNPVCRLRDQFVSHPLYTRVFGKSVFEVLPEGNDTFLTMYKYGNCKYSFGFSNGTLSITERGTVTKSKYELVPHEKFRGQVPHLLVEEYCHWWSRQENIIEFRPLPFKLAGNSSKNKTSHYVLDLKTRKLTQQDTQKCIIDVMSESWTNIVKYLSRFEKSEYMKIVCDSNNKATVELSRMRLQFHINDSFELESHEYEGMKVSLDHKRKDTLLGLQNGLLLCDKSGNQKFLVPYGQIEAHIPTHGKHQKVTIHLDKLRQPPFFIYEVDETMWQLKPGKSYAANFYLAYLHAITAHPLEDPFMGMTGTERALQILQSAHCWSSQPYDAESLFIMLNIFKLTPQRKTYSKVPSLETVSWPTFLPTAAAHEMFSFIIVVLFNDCQKLIFLFLKKKSTLEPQMLAKNFKSFKRYSCYNPNANLSEWFENCCDEAFCRFESKRGSSGTTKLFKQISQTSAKAISSLAILEQEMSNCLPNNTYDVLVQFLTHGSTLSGVTGEEFCLFRVDQWAAFDVKDNFLDLYIFAREVAEKSLRAEWTFFLTHLAFYGNDLDILLILQAVSLNSSFFADVHPPKIAAYQNPIEIQVNETELKNVLELCFPRVDEYLATNGWKCIYYHEYAYVGSSQLDEKKKIYLANEEKKVLLTIQHTAELNRETEIILSSIRQEWPCDFCSFSNSDTQSIKLININAAKNAINPLLLKWNQNRQLNDFLKNVSAICRSLPSVYKNCSPPTHLSLQDQPKVNSTKRKTQLNFQHMIVKYFSKLEVSSLGVGEVFSSGQIDCPSSIAITSDSKVEQLNIDMLKKRYQFLHDESQKLWKTICNAKNDSEVEHLVNSGLYPRIVPSLMLQKLISQTQDDRRVDNIILKNLIGDWGVALTWEQQTTRMIKFAGSKSLAHLLQKEIDAIPHVNWSPKKIPAWLIFEIEMNLIIRKVQVEVAQQMINPPGENHSVMQLNMGEGKTAVIVPLLCLKLADKGKLCRVVVLKALFRTNLASLRQSIGAISNRRVYTFPCRRDMEIGEKEAQIILRVYQECQNERGIVMTLPEYTLSFQLKMYETYMKKKNIDVLDLQRMRTLRTIRSNSPSQEQCYMLKTYKWLNENVRDILDESDEILHAKYQLIYTVGRKLSLDGGDLRWTVAQGLLKIVPENLKILYEKYGVEYIEWNSKCEKKNRKEIFTPCRLLQEQIYGELIETLAEDFLNGKTSIKFADLKSKDRKCIKEFLTNRKIDEGVYEKVMDILNDDIHLDTILILAGYLKYEVLRASLGKRWRVNYGVNPVGKLKMAVPFKAKDVAAENTEFGHPDIAICLTLLSYYYSGLNDDQLMQCFEILERFSYATKIYEGWINKVSDKSAVDPSVQNYEGLVLEDTKNRDEYLFPILRKNMYVIDFWLAETVFKHEARQFESKLMTTAWDLCSEDRKRKVTGFSGTNDSKNLLPATTSQNDLKQLEKTNENVRKTLLQPENEGYQALEANITDKNILKKLVKNKIPVLLDSGALMLELSNEQVAHEWLKLIAENDAVSFKENQVCDEGSTIESVEVKIIDAAIYFSEDDVLMVKDRQNRNTELEFSPFRDRLERCVVYMDDAHTRGTDLKFPLNTRACVTLGGKITRDKTVQACMRMRMLGKGHSICFWASQEAHNSIRELRNHHNSIRTEDVLLWIENNSANFEKDGLVHWASAGINYAQKRAAHHLWDTKDAAKLSENCCDDETVELMETYGKLKTETLFTEIIEHHFERLIKFNSSLEILRSFDFSVMNEGTKKLLKTKKEVLNRLKNFIPNVKRYAQLLDEEQEKELQQEKEVNVEVSKRPEKMTPKECKLDEDVKAFLQYGCYAWMNNSQKFHNFFKTSVVELPIVLKKYGFENLDRSWGSCVYATKDYLSVVENRTTRYSDYDISTILSSSRLMAMRKGELKLKQEIESAQFLRPVSWIACCHSQYFILLSPFEANEYLPLFRSKRAASVLHMYSPRLKPKQNVLIEVPQLVIPSIPRMVPITGCLVAQLTVFSGGLYFKNKEEQERYCEFTGFIPRPRSAKHNQDFEKGYIMNNGFVPRKYRHEVSQTILEQCKFANNPEKLIRGIAEYRHGYFPGSSHVSLLVVESKDMSNDYTQD